MRMRWRVLAAIVAVAVFLPFVPALRQGFIDYDDNEMFLDNEAYRGLSPAHLRWMFTTFTNGHWQPLAWLTLGADYRLWGMSGAGYHFTSLVWHCGNAILAALVFFLLLRRVRPGDDPGWQRVAAALAAVAWGVHPLRVESVAWATERRDVVSGFFYLLAVFAYLRARGDEARRAPWLAGSIVAAALSLMAKAWAMTLPAVLLVLDAYPLGRLGKGRAWFPVVLEKIPYALLAAGGALLARQAQQGWFTLAEHPPLARLGQAAYGLVFYVEKTLLPRALTPSHAVVLPLDPTTPRFALPALGVVAAGVLLLAFRRRWPAGLAAAAAYVASVAPVLGLTQAGPQLVADRYGYLATLPLFALAAGAASRPTRPAGRAVVAGVGLVVLVALGALSVRQTMLWRDDLTLWSHAVEVDPGDSFAQIALGKALYDAGRLEELVPHQEALLRLALERHSAPEYVESIKTNLSHTLATLAANAWRGGDAAGARALVERSVAVRPDDPALLTNAGAILVQTGAVDAGVAYLERALALDPGQTAARNALGVVQLRTGKLAEAEATFRQLVATAPGDVSALVNLGAAQRQQGRTADAAATWEQALRLDPGNVQARRNLDALHAEAP